jgi:hypothetical protein
MWILKNSKYLKDNFNSRALSQISYIYTFDFSTHYTTIPHEKSIKSPFEWNYSQVIVL